MSWLAIESHRNDVVHKMVFLSCVGKTENLMCSFDYDDDIRDKSLDEVMFIRDIRLCDNPISRKYRWPLRDLLNKLFFDSLGIEKRIKMISTFAMARVIRFYKNVTTSHRSTRGFVVDRWKFDSWSKQCPFQHWYPYLSKWDGWMMICCTCFRPSWFRTMEHWRHRWSFCWLMIFTMKTTSPHLKVFHE